MAYSDELLGQIPHNGQVLTYSSLRSAQDTPKDSQTINNPFCSDSCIITLYHPSSDEISLSLTPTGCVLSRAGTQLIITLLEKHAVKGFMEIKSEEFLEEMGVVPAVRKSCGLYVFEVVQNSLR